MVLVEQVLKKAMEVGLQAVADAVFGDSKQKPSTKSIAKAVDVLLDKEVEVEVTILKD